MKRLAATIACLMVIAAMVLATYYLSMERQVDKARVSATSQLEAYQNIFLAEIRKHQHMPFTISRERTILRLIEKRDSQLKANILLKAIQVRSGASTIFILNGKGDVIASSNYDQPDSLVGKSYWFHPYFDRSMEGREGSMYALGGKSGAPGYYLSHPIQLDAKIVGVAVVIFRFSELQHAWRATDNIIMAKDPYGVIVMANKDEWMHKTFEPASATQLKLARKEGLYSGIPITHIQVTSGDSHGDRWVIADGRRYLIQELRIRGRRWELVALSPWSTMVDQSIRLSLITGLTSLVILAGLLLIRANRTKALMERRFEASRRARRIDGKREESLRLLADSIAHQIRNPLLGIGGNANLLKRKLPDDEEMRDHLVTILDCCQDLEQVVVSVRDYIGLVPRTIAPLDLAPLVLEACRKAVTAVGSPKGSVQWNMDMEPARLHLDADLISKALLEIICNALEARQGDVIAITLSGAWHVSHECSDEPEISEGNCYILTVCDSGCGIDAKIFDNVMDPFFSTKPNGTGLGLAKAKRVMQIFQGGLAITSPVPGRADCNTMVELTIPHHSDLE